MKKNIKIRKPKRKIKKLSLVAKAAIFFNLSLCTYFGSVLYINTETTRLTVKIQELQVACDELKQQNDTLKYDINTLSGRDRIYEIMEDTDMNVDNKNVYAVASMAPIELP